MPLYAVFWHAAHLMAGTLIMMSGSLLSLGLSSGYPLRLRLPRKWHLQPSNLTRPQATALALLTGGICLYSSRHVHLQQQSAAGHQIQCNAVSVGRPHLCQHDRYMLLQSWADRADGVAVCHRTFVQTRSLSLPGS